MRKHRTWALIALALGLAAVRIAWGWLVARPVLERAEIDDAEARVAAALADARGQRCERPVLRGEADPSDATAELAALLDRDGRFATCWELLAERRADVFDALNATGHEDELPPDDAPRGDGAGPSVDPDWTYPAFGRPLHATPLPIETQVLLACGGLDVEVQRIVAHASVCTPFPIGAVSSPRSMASVVDALAVFARDRLRHGALREGLALLLDAARLAQDAARGRPDLAAATISLGVAGNRVTGQLQMLLSTALPFADADLASLEREATVLATTAPSPDLFGRDDAIALAAERLVSLGWRAPHGIDLPAPDDEFTERLVLEGRLAIALDAATRFAALACTQGEARGACRGRWTAELARARHEAESTPRWPTYFGPRASMHELAIETWPERLASVLRQMDRALRAEATLRALPAFFAFRRLRDRGCPDLAAIRALLATDDARAALAGFGGELSAYSTTLEYGAIDLCAPTWLSPLAPDVRLPVIELYCIAFPVAP